uniref:HEAT repeat-containing protein 6 isoform X1 n=1 Tax=Vespula vulgaris TaxID=7454 RepID=UPI0021415A89|nr:HEAT repeat-containing protein 6 isoform X1 [Vespula vulgaris]
MASMHVSSSIESSNIKFVNLIERILSLTHTKLSDKRLINSCLNDLNDIDYRHISITNNDAVLLLINQLCAIVPPTETLLVKNTCLFLANVIQNDLVFQGRTFAACTRWILDALKFSQPFAWISILLALKSVLVTGNFDNINQYLQSLLGDKGLLNKYLIPQNEEWTDLNLQAICCLEGILINKKSNTYISQEYICIIKDVVLNAVSLLPCSNHNIQCYSKILCLCLRILRTAIIDKLIPVSSDLIGEILGVVQAFLFYGIKDYLPIQPQLLRPAAMNLPERPHVVPKCKNQKVPKSKSKKQMSKKSMSEDKRIISPENKRIYKYSSESEISDTETNDSVLADSKVRLEAVHLLQALIENTQAREIFGYWPQIVATGSRNDARVLARSILKEPNTKVRQNVLSALTELLIGARPFLIHAEDVQPTSFITFFGTVYLMVKELHFTLSLVLNTEKNAAVLTHLLKCIAALIQGTPYAKLKPGLATKLIRNCRSHIQHKDPTVKVATFLVFEGLVWNDPITPEIFEILAKQSNVNSDSPEANTSSINDITTQEEEIDIEDLNDSKIESDNQDNLSKDKGISSLLQVCLNNVSNKCTSTPVQLQSLKLIGSLAFNTRDLVFPYLERVTTTLISVLADSETQIILHSCRALEIIAGCLANTDSSHNSLLFWNIVFEPMTLLAQHEQTILREAACDCLGTIGSNMFTQLTRQQNVLLKTILIGSIHDDESAVRAAGLRALGMLITLPPLEEDTGFLMDLADIVCFGLDDQNLGVRIKATWALANLCDCLSRRTCNEDMEPIPFDILLPKLYQTSVRAAKDNDKVKCNAVRALGSILYLCPDREILKDTSSGLDALINCAVLGNDMKVRWNACRALGLVLSHNPDDVLPSSWQEQVFPALCNLICHSPNFKVRTNAAWALYSCKSYGKYTPTLWKSIVLAFENCQHVPSYVEYSHRDTLVQQLCLTLSHLAAHTKVSELQNVWVEIGDHIENISNYIKKFQENILPEKVGNLIEAKAHLEKCVKTAKSSQEQRIANILANLFDRTSHYDNLDSLSIM